MSSSKEKGFTLRPSVHQPLDPSSAETTLRTLEDAFHRIYTRNASGLTFEELYRGAYNLVIHNYGDQLYSALVRSMTQHLWEIAKTVESAQGLQFLEELSSQWSKQAKSMEVIREILMYMERSYLTVQENITLRQLGLHLWRHHVMKSYKIGDRLLVNFLDHVHRERTGEVIDRGLMRNLNLMLSELGPSAYFEDFERHFLDSTADFYRQEAQQYIHTDNCSDYLRRVERRRNEEVERVSHYLHPQSEPTITAVVVDQMIGNHVRLLVEMENSGLVSMIIGDQHDDLAHMYALFSRVTEHDGRQIMKDVMINYLREAGRQLVIDPEGMKDPVDFVQRLLNAKDKYDKIIRLSFGNDKIFQDSLKWVFENFINLNNRSPEFLSLFLDCKLRTGFKVVNEDTVETVVDKVISLFRYLQDKDVFEKYHRQHLAQRLLAGTISDDTERSLILKLKTECGSHFTSKMECMITDIKTSKDVLHGFNKMMSSSELAREGPTLAVQVLTARSWAIQSGARSCNLPTEILTMCDTFAAYYMSIKRGRRLAWQTNAGTADLKTTFGNGREHELNVSTHQMCILLLFNLADRLSYREIEQATAIPPEDLKRDLKSLACVRGKQVLRKEPTSKALSEADVFHFNDEFSSKHSKVKISTVLSGKESEPETQETRRKVEGDRKPQIDAAIVRIMKSRRVLDHSRLISEVTEQLQGWFLPDPSTIKKRIEFQIENEILERDPIDRKLFRYLA